jgi:hypothetical protein
LGVCYGHDEPGPKKRTTGRFQVEAADFLISPWATYLADIAGFSAHTVWKEAHMRRPQEAELDRAA